LHLVWQFAVEKNILPDQKAQWARNNQNRQDKEQVRIGLELFQTVIVQVKPGITKGADWMKNAVTQAFSEPVPGIKIDKNQCSPQYLNRQRNPDHQKHNRTGIGKWLQV